MKRAALVLALLLGSAGPAHANLIYDLASDWSNTSNPNGPWSYNGGSIPLPHQANYDPTNVVGFTTTQPAWAVAQQPAAGWTPPGDQIPVWLKSVGNNTVGFDMPAGQVIVHSWDPTNGAPNTDPANVTWTSPINGTVVITGDTWLARKTLGRSDDWGLFFNNSPLANGTLTSSDLFTSTNPDNIGTFTETVHVGDVVRFDVTQDPNSPFGEYAGVGLTIVASTSSSTPEPSSLALFGFGAAGLAWYWRRRAHGGTAKSPKESNG